VYTDIAVVTLTQHYKSDTVKSSEKKTLLMHKQDGRWLIVEERLGG